MHVLSKQTDITEESNVRKRPDFSRPWEQPNSCKPLSKRPSPRTAAEAQTIPTANPDARAEPAKSGNDAPAAAAASSLPLRPPWPTATESTGSLLLLRLPRPFLVLRLAEAHSRSAA
jgi:hypothetical protein